MAKHTEIKVGSRGEWVVRKNGQDVAVVVTNKSKKVGGRGYQFTVKELRDGRMVGREFTRGSGSFRRPGQPAKSFAGKKPAGSRSRPKSGGAKNVTVSSSRFDRSARAPSAPASSGLSSLRGRGRAGAPSTRTPARGRKKKEEGVRFRPPSPLAKDVMRAIERTDGSEHQIRGAVSSVLAQVSFQAYYGHFPSSPARPTW